MRNGLIIGCGYLGRRVAQAWKIQGLQVYAVTRHLVKADALRDLGCVPIVGDVTSATCQPSLPDVPFDAVVFAVGRERGTTATHQEVFVEGLRNALRQLNRLTRGVRRVVYVSSVGVYGDARHGWSDEQTAPAPATPGGEACWQAEQLLHAPPWHDRHVVLRLAGLYGPDRVPRSTDIVQGGPLAVRADGFLNLIHVDDAARVVVAAAAADQPPSLLCVSDGCPVLRRDYLSEVARQLQVPQPEFVAPQSDTPQSRGRASKRISNRQLLATLDITIQFPSYREGLAAIYDSGPPLG